MKSRITLQSSVIRLFIGTIMTSILVVGTERVKQYTFEAESLEACLT